MIRSLTIAVLLTVLPHATAENPATSLNVGDDCPRVSAVDDSGEAWKIADHLGKRKIVLFFYPADMTHHCTQQVCGFQKRLKDFQAADTLVVGISGDSVRNHRLFKEKHQIEIPLLADPHGKVAKAFGVPIRNGGKIVRQLDGKPTVLKRGVTTGRWTFIVGLDGRILHKYANVDAQENSANMLKLVRQLTVSAD